MEGILVPKDVKTKMKAAKRKPDESRVERLSLTIKKGVTGWKEIKKVLNKGENVITGGKTLNGNIGS